MPEPPERASATGASVGFVTDVAGDAELTAGEAVAVDALGLGLAVRLGCGLALGLGVTDRGALGVRALTAGDGLCCGVVPPPPEPPPLELPAWSM